MRIVLKQEGTNITMLCWWHCSDAKNAKDLAIKVGAQYKNETKIKYKEVPPLDTTSSTTILRTDNEDWSGG